MWVWGSYSAKWNSFKSLILLLVMGATQSIFVYKACYRQKTGQFMLNQCLFVCQHILQ